MSDTTRKIYFEIGDKNVASTFEQLKRIANESGRSIIETGNQYAKTGREINNFLEQEIRLRERKSKLEYEERRIGITEDYEKSYGKAKTDAGRERATNTYTGRMREVSRDEREVRSQSNLLREIIETLRQTARDEIRENRKGVEEQVKLYTQGKLKGLSPEDEAKLKIQSQMLGKNKEMKSDEKSLASPVFWGALMGTLIPQIIQKISGVVSADSGERAFNTLLGSIPLIGGILEGTRERALKARTDLQTTSLSYLAKGGRGGIGLYSGVGYGMTTSEMYGIAGETARARMMSGGNARSAIDIAALEKAYGLDKNQLLRLSGTERFGGGGAMQDTGTLISVLRSQGLWDKDSQTKIPKLLEMLVNLQEDQIKRFGSVDNASNMTNLSVMSKLGTKYVRDTSYITNMNNAIANPQNEYQQARSLSVLAGLNSRGDLWDLQTMQQRGLSQKGYMSGIMKQIGSRYGTSGNLRKLALSQTLGSTYSNEDINRIFEVYDKNPNLFDQGFDEKSLKSLVGNFSNQTRALGKSRTSALSKDIAQTTDAYTQGALPGAMNLIEKTMSKISKDLVEASDKIGKSLGVNVKQHEYNMATILAGGNEDAAKSVVDRMRNMSVIDMFKEIFGSGNSFKKENPVYGK